jgi:recombinational DNA repair ATPase RecF
MESGFFIKGGCIMSDRPQKLIRIRVENLEKVQVAELVFPEDSPIVEISSGGENAQGKTSLLKAFDLLRKGRAGLGRDPVHDGEDEAFVSVELTDYLIESTVSYDGKVGTRIEPKDGSPVQTTRDIIKELFKGKDGKIVDIDPQAIRDKNSIDKFRLAMQLTGKEAEIDALSEQYEVLYKKRTTANQLFVESFNQLKGLVKPDPDLPEQEIPASELTAELQAIQRLELRKQSAQSTVERLKADLVYDVKTKKESAKSNCDNLEREYREADSDVQDARWQIEKLEKELAEQRESLKIAESARKTKANEIDAALTEYKSIDTESVDFSSCPAIAEAQAEYDSITVPDAEEIEAKIEANEAMNVKIREARAYREKFQLNKDRKAEHARIDKEMKSIEKQKIDILKNSELPVEGLSVDTRQKIMTFNGRDVDQLSEAEALELYAMIQVEQHPGVPFFIIKSGSGIGKTIIDRLCQYALKRGAQGVIEKLEAGSLPGLVFVNGVGKAKE